MVQNLFELHKPVRNRIKKLEPTSLIFQAINKLAVCDGNPDERAYIPWELLLLIKWTFLYSQGASQLTKKATEVDLNRCLNDIKNLYSNIRLPSQEETEHTELVYKFLRRTLFQQLPYQLRDYEVKSVIGRQLILFADIGKDYEINRRFQSIIPITITEFILLCFLTWAQLNTQRNSTLIVRNFSNAANLSDTEHFLNFLSHDLHSGKDYFEKDIQVKRKTLEVEVYELTPLVMYPFFGNGSTFINYSKKLFNVTVANYVHSVLKDCDADFTRDFGNIFQQYIEMGFKYSNFAYLPENQVKGLLPKGSKRVDFVIPYKDCTVLVEVKSAEMHHIPKVLQTTESLTEDLEDSIIKAVLQIYEVANHLRNSGTSSKIHNTEHFYGLVITYQEHYLGASAQVWQEFLGSCVEPELRKKDMSSNLIPYENLHFLSAMEFDYLIGGLKKMNHLSLPQILEKVKQHNASAHTAKFMFVQHLEEVFDMKCYVPDYLEDRFEVMFQEVSKRLKG